MTSATTPVVADHEQWLSQGDVFQEMLVVRVGVADSVPAASLERAPAMLVSHGCAIDKKTSSGRSKLEYLTFLPVHDVGQLPPERAQTLRSYAGQLLPYDAMYLGEIEMLGECYISLTDPFTLPALLLRPELQEFSTEQTGHEADVRIVPTMSDSRLGCLTTGALDMFWLKWSVHWTRIKPTLPGTGAHIEPADQAPPPG